MRVVSFSLSPEMLQYAVGLWLVTGVLSDVLPCPPGNTTCGSATTVAAARDCTSSNCTATTTEPSAQPRTENLPCSPTNENCSTLSTGGESAVNSSAEKSLSTTTKFSPSPFLGVIPDRPGSVVVGEVFHESLGPRTQGGGFSFPRQASVREYALPGGEPFRPRPPHAVEIQIGGSGYGGDYRPAGSSGYGRPDIEIRPHPGYGGKTEIEIRPHSGYSGLKPPPPEIEISSHKPLGTFVEQDLSLKSVYGKPAADLNDQLSYGKPDQVKFRPTAEHGTRTAEHGTRTAQHREYGKPYDPGNAIDYTGYPESKPKQPFYEGYENMKNLLKPTKGSGPYFYEDNYQESMKPIQENTDDDPHKIPFPPVGPSAGGGDGYKQIEHKGGGKWKTLLKFLTTVLPIGLLFAALTPNVLVVSPSEDPGTAKGSARPPSGTIKRSLEAPLGPCGLRKLCEALSESPADFEQFLKAAKEGSTEELREIIKKAEEKDCSSIGCMQFQELRPTQPTYR